MPIHEHQIQPTLFKQFLFNLKSAMDQEKLTLEKELINVLNAKYLKLPFVLLEIARLLPL